MRDHRGRFTSPRQIIVVEDSSAFFACFDAVEFETESFPLVYDSVNSAWCEFPCIYEVRANNLILHWDPRYPRELSIVKVLDNSRA